MEIGLLLQQNVTSYDACLTSSGLLLLSVIRPNTEYGTEVWDFGVHHTEGAKKILGCSSKKCNKAVRRDLGLETLKSCRNKKCWFKSATMPEDRYPKRLFSQEWNVKPCRGRQRKTWGKVIDDIFLLLGLDKYEWLEDIEKKDS